MEKYYICPNCCRDRYLIKFMKRSPKASGICIVCQKKSSKNTRVEKGAEICNFCRFLVRYHYPEYVYNHHWGGEDVPSLFNCKNPIISHEFANYVGREEEVESFLYTLLDLDNLHHPIPLYAGFDTDFGRMMFPYSIKSEKSKLWSFYKKALQKENYYLLEAKAKDEMACYFEDLKVTLKPKSNFFRARIGFKEISKKMSVRLVSLKKPFSSSDISAPPPLKATAGRANRQGVSYLYLSSDRKTALGEVRPHPGHYVSIGEFIQTSPITVIDLSFIDLHKYYKDEKSLGSFKFLRDIATELSLPILPEEKEKYLVTQFIADIARQMSYDGIIFSSSLSDGYNLVAFNQNHFKYKRGSSELHKIESLDYDMKKVEYDFDDFMERAIER